MHLSDAVLESVMVLFRLAAGAVAEVVYPGTFVLDLTLNQRAVVHSEN